MVGGGPAAVAHPALSEVIQLLEVEEMQGPDCCPVRPNRGPQEPRGHLGTLGGHRTGGRLCMASETFPKRGPTVSGLGHLSPPPRKRVDHLFCISGCVWFSL